jgi:hypothetical protein
MAGGAAREKYFKNINENSLYKLILNSKKGVKQIIEKGPKVPKNSKNTPHSNLLDGPNKSIIRKKKHRSVDHCHDFLNEHSTF